MREMDTESPVVWPAWCYTGDTSSPDSDLKPRKRRTMNGNSHHRDSHILTTEYNNNHPLNTSSRSPPVSAHGPHAPGSIKNERLSPSTPDTLSRSRSVTPSSGGYPGTPPGQEMPRNYSEFMRSLAAKYNHANPNDYFGGIRNGYPLLKPPFDLQNLSPIPSLPNLNLQGNVSLSSKTKLPTPDTTDLSLAAAALLNPFASPTPFPQLIDMSSTHALLAMVRTAKEAEVHGLLKSNSETKRPSEDTPSLSDLPVSTPLDLSAASVTGGMQNTCGAKRARMSPRNENDIKAEKDKTKEHVHRMHDGLDNNEVAGWNVDDVCDFVSSIDICAEYAQKFHDQRIDGSALPLLTEDHLTTTMGLKLGPALKLRSILAKKTGSCSVCLHCVHCHTSPSMSSSPAETVTSPSRVGIPSPRGDVEEGIGSSAPT